MKEDSGIKDDTTELSVKKTMNNLPTKLQTSKVSNRLQLLRDLNEIVQPGFKDSENNVPIEAIAKAICKILPNTVIPRYNDSKSRRAVLQLLESLIGGQCSAIAFSTLTGAMRDHFAGWGSVDFKPSPPNARTAVMALDWTFLIARKGLKEGTWFSGAELKRFMELQSILVTIVYGSAFGSTSISRIATRLTIMLQSMWNTEPSVFANAIPDLDASHKTLVYGAYFINWLIDTKGHNEQTFKKFGSSIKNQLIDILVKTILAAKTKTNSHIIRGTYPLLRRVNHDEFKEHILPALLKAMLRNPEIVMGTVGYLLAGLKIDLSQYAEQLGKPFASQLHAKDDITRDEAVAAVASLAIQCSDPEAIKSLLSVIFGVLGGSEGKLSVNTQKMSLLEAAGKLAINAVSSTSLVTPISELATGYFIKILETEVHEGTLLVTLSALGMWVEKFRDGNVPKSFLEWVPKGLALKSSTSLVRQAYLQCIQSTIDAAGCAQSCITLTPTLLKLVENCIKQSSQMTLVSEGAHAIGCLVKLSEVAPAEKAGVYSEMFKTLNDSPVFVNDRFLASSSPKTLASLASIAEKMVGQLDDSKINSKRWYLILVLALTCSDTNTRKHAQNLTKKIALLHQHKMDNKDGNMPLLALIQELEKFSFNSHQVNVISENSIEERGVPPGGLTASGPLGSGLTPPVGTTFEVKAAFIISALKSIVGAASSAKYKTTEIKEIALHLVMICHHPSAVNTNGRRLWYCLVNKGLGLDAKDLVKFESKRIISKIISFISSSDYISQKAGVLATKELAGKINQDALIPIIIEMADTALKDKNATNISLVDYEIFLTPEGELYDKSILENLLNETSLKTTNIKRENKAYSHKDQMEEIALRKELEEKKRREGKISEPKLNAKQKEVLDNQLEKESMVRTRIKDANENTAPAIALLSAAVEECPKAFVESVGGYPKHITSAIFRGLKSPLLSDSLIPIFRDLRYSAFDCTDGDEDESLSQVVAALTLQVIDPVSKRFGLDNSNKSDKESFQTSLREVVQKLHRISVPRKSGRGDQFDDDELDLACPLTTPAFNYCFTLINYAISCNKDDEVILEQVLQMISEHALLRGDCGGNEIENTVNRLLEIDELHPKYLPRADIFRLLIDIVATTEGTRIQQVAVSTLTEVAEASSGKVGCAVATMEEFEILMNGLQMEIVSVRDACLRGLLKMVDALDTIDWTENSVDLEEVRKKLCQRVWIAKYDQDSIENAKYASNLWDKALLAKAFDGQYLANSVLLDVAHPMDCIRRASAESLAAILQSNEMSSNAATILESLLETYVDKLEMTPPVLDSFGRVIQTQIDHWEPRSGVAIALEKIAPYYGQDANFVKTVTKVATFFVQQGLGDRSEHVRKHMLDAAVVTVNLHGKDSAEALLPVFEEFMENAPKSGIYDNVRQSVIILMGSLAKHLDSSDPKVRPIMRQLIIALKTPSQQVQEAVANCLPPLVPAIKEEAPEIVSKLIATLLGDQVSYGERKGAAYGVAGIVKGLGILSLKQLDIMGKLTEAITNKKIPNHREGALFAFEMLCNMLGRLFEPYIVHILPHLLLCFGDPVEHVRQAADDTARAVMSKLSAHGVKLVLPALLNALEEDQWRTKTGSVELLGAMAFCAPKQLSSCLPSIVPKLIEVLGDSHHKVQNAGTQALKQIGKVIRNPEIQAIVPVLLRALQDPSKKTGICLQTLLDTKFVHFIDAPSLALIMPVVQRAFQDRSTETRKMAAQIIGNMYSLTDQKDLSPYLPGIIPGLKASLLDPVPEVRAVSARALGAMVKGMGESSFEELLPWLMATLTSETSSVDRSGAAQGLAEVVGGLGVEKMNALLPDILKTAERTDISPHVKDGYIMMFIYMPTVFPEEFTPYISQIISPILRALADENEFVRETAYKAGQRLVMTYADKAIMMLLPELERGLFDENWRIRHSSIQLLGDLLYKVSGVSGKMTTETAGEDDNFGTEQSQRAITKTLGQERRNRVLAGLYMGRSDVALMVRQAALHVWKVVVSNTPKTLREILPTLFNLLLGCLASNSFDKRQIAARTLGDLVKKLGERVLPEIIPILEKGLESPQPEKRQGVCVGLSEIMISTSKDMVLSFVESLVPTVRKALCDETPEVRLAAAKTFESLHNTVGSRALDDILPQMLEQLTSSKVEDEENETLRENTLDGLRQVMAIKARAVLPYLVPQLIAPPVNMKAIASVAPVAGDALHRHLAKILPAILQALADSQGDTAIDEELLDHAQTVVLSVHDDEDEVGLSCIMDELLGACGSGKATGGNESSSYQRAAITLLHIFCRDTKMDFSGYVPQLIRTAILMFTSGDTTILQEAWNTLTAVTKTLDASEQMAHVSDVRQAVRFAVSDMRDKRSQSQEDLGNAEVTLPGFCLPKGIQPILPIFRESILNGAPELKEQAANGLAEVIALSNADALKPSVVHITGPLIRILGDRFASNVKTAVLDTLASLLYKASILLKPFFPQLQTTFVKALNDTNRTVRLKAGIALSHLIVIHMRPDPLFNELINGIKGASDDTSVKDTYLQALRGCLEPAGDKMSAPIRRQILPQLIALTDNTGATGGLVVEDTSRSAAAGCIGAYLRWLPTEDADAIMNNHLLAGDDVDLDWTVRHGRSTALFVALKETPSRVFSGSNKKKVVQAILSYLAADRIPIVQNGIRSCAFLFTHCIKPTPPKHTRDEQDDIIEMAPQEIPPELIAPFSKTLKHNSNDVKQLVAVVSSYLAKSIVDKKPTVADGGLLPKDLLRSLLPLLVNGTKEKNSAVKSSSESALVNILRLRQKQENGTKECLQILEGGAREALQDIISKVLLKTANQPEGKEEQIDDTLLV